MTQKISEAQIQLKNKLSGVRWVVRENLHFTVKFLGSVPEDRVEPILRALEPPIGERQRFLLAAKGIGVFPDLRRPRVVWVGLGAEAMARLAGDVEQALEPLGFPRENRAFRPHLTIGRWRDGGRAGAAVEREIESWKGRDFGACWVEEVILFRSDLKPQGPVYSPLGAIPLGGKAN
jgi:RNA 2',3'-cyclic 3'-phosphodiesterase